MRFAEMFRDDNTKQLSLGRVCASLILLYLLGCTGHMMIATKTLQDIPGNWMTAMLAFYGINKIASTTANIKGTAGNGAE